MAASLSTPTILSLTPPFPLPNSHNPTSKALFFTPLKPTPKNPVLKQKSASQIQASATDFDPGLLQQAIQLVKSSPPTWQSALLSNAAIFVFGLSPPRFAEAFLLGTLTWHAFSYLGFLLVATYFVIVSSLDDHLIIFLIHFLIHPSHAW